MSDETTVQLGHQELQDHNELVEYIRKLLEKIKLLTDLYDQNLTALTEHNESESSHPDLRILLAEGNDELQNQLDSFKDDITKKTDATDKRITDGLNDFDLRLRNAVEVNNVQNDRLTALEADVALKIYDKDVSAVGHTGQFDDILNRPKITISDATNEHTGNSIRITGGNTNFVLPSTITADLKGNVTGNVKGNVTGNAATATKLAAKRTIALSGAATGTATGFDGTANIAIPVTSLDASKLTGTASVSTTGNAATATRADSAASADTAANATNATNSNAANQLQAFVNDNFTSGNHYVKAIRSSQGWSTHLWMCYNNGAKMADEVSVNYANNAGYASEANKATFDKNGRNISGYAWSVAVDGSTLKVRYGDGSGTDFSLLGSLPKAYNDVGSTIYAGITPDENLTYGATIAGSRLTVGVGIDFDGTRKDGGSVSPSCPGTWVRVSGWSSRGDGLGFWRRIA